MMGTGSYQAMASSVGWRLLDISTLSSPLYTLR